ncbi:hypothetical protein CHUAL_003579 [Chamberlinius hualienensis]
MARRSNSDNWLHKMGTILAICGVVGSRTVSTFSETSISAQVKANQLNNANYASNVIAELLKRNIDLRFDMQQVEYLFPNGISQRCKQDLTSIITTMILSNDTWTWEMLDSYGKIPSGLMKGNFVWSGNFWQCVAVNVNDRQVIDENTTEKLGKTRFVGEYCLVKLITPFTSESAKYKPGFVGVLMGICLPNTCSLEDKQILFDHYLDSSVQIRINPKFCQTMKRNSMDGSAITLTVVLLIPAILVIIATVIRYYSNDTLTTENYAILRMLCYVFAAQNSIKSLFHTLEIGKAGSVITCLYGIRSIFIVVVIWIHVTSLSLAEFPWKNPFDCDSLLNDPFINVYSQLFGIMTVYFVMSGLCLMYSSMLKAKRQNGSISIVTCYLNRYLRLTLPYIYVVSFYAGPLYYLGKGPYWPHAYEYQKTCRGNWMGYLLLQSILFKIKTQECVVGEWYIFSDWQLYLVAVPIVWIIIRRPTFGILCFAIGTIASTVVLVLKQLSSPFSLFFNTYLEHYHSQDENFR